MTRIISAQEASQHASRGDCWLIIHGYVFDVSNFMRAKEGLDCGQEFEEIKHSKDARVLALTRQIGRLEGTVKPFPMADQATKGHATSKDDGELKDPSSPLLVGAILLGLGLAAYYVYQRRR
ncbi:hypothetical protein BASA81_000440 [Batrachochytrium salamandrivorans]|nr:hypothetical protein BASA81_000440 [Batrachochytrium salamandrivorans]